MSYPNPKGLELCAKKKCVLTADHIGPHRKRRGSLLACPHNIPNFGPPCPVCDEKNTEVNE